MNKIFVDYPGGHSRAKCMLDVNMVVGLPVRMRLHMMCVLAEGGPRKELNSVQSTTKTMTYGETSHNFLVGRLYFLCSEVMAT